MVGWQFGDVRLSDRAQGLFEQIVHTGSLVLRRVGRDRAGEIGAHRFLNNARVTHQAIVDTLSERTIKACQGRIIVAVQGTPARLILPSAMLRAQALVQQAEEQAWAFSFTR